jgi:hypothetical protein
MLLICKHFKAYKNDALLKPVVTRYIKYWKDIPMLYSFAFILDPRGKLKCFIKVLKLLGNFLGVDYSSYLTEVRAQLNIIYKMYDGKFGAAKKKTCLQPPSTGKKNTAWDDILQMMMMMITISLQLLDLATLSGPLLSRCVKGLVLLLLLDLLWVLVMNYLTIWIVTLSPNLMIGGGMNICPFNLC